PPPPRRRPGAPVALLDRARADPNWPPPPPIARSALGNPWRSSITRERPRNGPPPSCRARRSIEYQEEQDVRGHVDDQGEEDEDQGEIDPRMQSPLRPRAGPEHPVDVLSGIGHGVRQRQDHPRQCRLRRQRARVVAERVEHPEEDGRQGNVEQREAPDPERNLTVEPVVG